MLGRISRASPQFISMSDGSWLGTWACMERMTAISSIDEATFGKSSLASMPLWPNFENLKGEGKAAPVRRSVGRFGVGKGLPAYRASIGLGSKVSTWEGPPFMNRWITRFALAGKCGSLGARG